MFDAVDLLIVVSLSFVVLYFWYEHKTVGICRWLGGIKIDETPAQFDERKSREREQESS